MNPSPLPSPDAPPAQWTPDQPLPHPMTDEQFGARWNHLMDGLSDFGQPWRVALRLAREAAGAAPALPVGRAGLPSREQLAALLAEHMDFRWARHAWASAVRGRAPRSSANDKLWQEAQLEVGRAIDAYGKSQRGSVGDRMVARGHLSDVIDELCVICGGLSRGAGGGDTPTGWILEDAEGYQSSLMDDENEARETAVWWAKTLGIIPPISIHPLYKHPARSPSGPPQEAAQ